MDDLDALLNDLQDTTLAPASLKSTEADLLAQLSSIPNTSVRHERKFDKLPSRTKAPIQEKILIPEINRKICHVCQESIASGGAALQGKYYHTEHFACNLCKRSLKNTPTFLKDDKLWCERDYHRIYSPECFFCHEPIKGTSIEALGKSFHTDHFFCAQCGMNLALETYMEYQGKAFCADDYSTLFASRCATCIKSLTEDYISALGKSFHMKCFICSTKDCNKVLPTTGYYHQDNIPYCEYHFYALSDNICAVCNDIIIGRCVVAFDKKFHIAHFGCSFCRKNLDSAAGGYKEKEKKPYCSACYVKLFS